MATLQNSCSTCYKSQVPECCEYYLIGGLTPGTSYHVIATNSKGMKFEVDDDEPADVDGNAKIILPEGMNTVAGGTITLELFDLNNLVVGSDQFCAPLPFTTCDGEFTCIELSFYKLSLADGVPETWQLLCLCPEDAVCDGMCSVPVDDTEFLGIIDELQVGEQSDGYYLIHDTKAFVEIKDGAIYQVHTCCNGIIGYYVGTEGPHQFNEDTQNWESMFTYQATSWNFGVAVFFSGSIPEFATAAFQVSTDSGVTWSTLKTGITSAELAAEDSVNTALTSFRSRILVTMPDGCSYPSAISTLTE